MTREEMAVLARQNVATWKPISQETWDKLYILLAPMRAARTERLKAARRLDRAS